MDEKKPTECRCIERLILMIIEQDVKFQPIIIKLETKEEADLFWELLIHCSTKRKGKLFSFANLLSNWFSNEAHL